jgi:hypothetical protein
LLSFHNATQQKGATTTTFSISDLLGNLADGAPGGREKEVPPRLQAKAKMTSGPMPL